MAAETPPGQRRWLITGVSSGLGRAIAEAALARGDAVAGTVRNARDASGFEALAPGRASAILLDATDLAGTPDAVAEAERRIGGIDVLVANAGYSLEGTIEATALEDIAGQIAVHLLAPFILAKAVMPGMRARGGGRILTIGSLAAHAPNPGTAVYAAAKAAIETLSIGLAREVAPFGIRVTTIVPGAFRTRLGSARRSATAEIAGYAESDAARRARLAALSGHQRGDPAKAAKVILQLVDSADPPVRLALGPDALEGLRAHAEVLLADARHWETLSGSTDFDQNLTPTATP